MKTVSWFSAGVSSAVATKIAINQIDEIIYTHIDDQHPDSMRFIKDCEKWFGKPVLILQSPYKSVDAACRGRSFINGIHGAACTDYLKKRVRKEWESRQTDKLRYVWGFDMAETRPRAGHKYSRCEGVVQAMPQQEHLFPLVDQKLHKPQVHEILRASGIKRPYMYELGYNNNNCIGCVKGRMGYWNKIRVDFPEVFKARSELERLIGRSCINGIFLDELDPTAGREQTAIEDDCGIMCELIKL